jgi:hypothetical protein
MMKLNKLGVDANERDLFESTTKTPEDYAKDVYDDQITSDINAFDAFYQVRQVIVGLHSCDAILGKSRLSISIQGFDFMDLIPIPPAISDVIAHVAEREKESSKLDFEDNVFF